MSTSSRSSIPATSSSAAGPPTSPGPARCSAGSRRSTSTDGHDGTRQPVVRHDRRQRRRGPAGQPVQPARLDQSATRRSGRAAGSARSRVIDGSGGLRSARAVDVSCGAQIYTHCTAKRCVLRHAHPGRRSAPDDHRRPRLHRRQRVVNAGVTIGDHAVIAAGAVVTSDVAPYTSWRVFRPAGIGRVELDGSDVRFVYDLQSTAT